jgi:hypothetical protein
MIDKSIKENPKMMEKMGKQINSSVKYITYLLKFFYFDDQKEKMDEHFFFYDNFFSQIGVFKLSIFSENFFFDSIKMPKFKCD